MPVPKIKNLILLILAVTVVFLMLLVVPNLTARNQQREKLHEQLEILFDSCGVELVPEKLPTESTLYAVELDGQADQQRIARALLGENCSLDTDSTLFVSTYTSELGKCTFRLGGGFSAELASVEQRANQTRTARQLLRQMEYVAEQLPEPVVSGSGDAQFALSQLLLGVPVLSDGLTLTLTADGGARLEGSAFIGTSHITRVSENACISCADALVALLAERDALGWMGSRVEQVRQGYVYAETASAAVRMVPVWIIETDTAVFRVNGLSGELTQTDE